MITAVILLTVLAVKDEIVGFIDLYSTLQGNKVAYMINTFIMVFSGYMEMWFLVDFDSNWTKRILVALIVSTLAACGGCVVLHYKKRLKQLLRRKRISIGMKKKWGERKQQPKEEAQSVQILKEIIEKSDDMSQGSSDNIPPSNKTD